MRVTLKSAYLPYDSTDGARYLVETLWPEGVDTYGLSPFLWVRELAPSYDLKEMAIWTHWTPEKFRDEYKQELQEPESRTWFDRIVKEAEGGTVTLLHHSHKKESQILPQDTSVYYLKEFLEAELNKCPEGGSTQDAEQWANEGGR